MTGIKASPQGLEKIKAAFKLKGKSQAYIAGSVGCTRQTVAKFLAGQKSIDQSIFQALCAELNLTYAQVADLEVQQPSPIGQELVEPVRAKVKTYLVVLWK